MKLSPWISSIVSLAFCAHAVEWFDADISGYASWPTDGSAVTVTNAGTWTGTENAVLAPSNGLARLRLNATDHHAPLRFTPAISKSFTEADLTVTTALRFQTSTDAPLAIDPTTKAALTVAGDSNGQPVFHGFAADTAGTTNRWFALTGADPVAGVDMEVVVSFKKDEGNLYVRYAVDGQTLYRNGEEWLPSYIVSGPDRLSAVSYAGLSEISTLFGVTSAGATEYTALTIPALPGMTLDAVTVAGVPVEPGQDGTYVVEAGSSVVVSFVPAPGHILNVPSMTFLATGADMTLPVDGRPVPIDATASLRITEVMASNETGLKTSNGLSGLDWVEIQNLSPVDIDISGWPITDDPTKAFSKWKTVKGRAVVPANGYLVVFADSGNTSWSAADAHAALGLSSSGEAIALATPDQTIVSQWSFGQQFDDVSFGYGHLSKTILPAHAAAEYRVGGTGDWTPVRGPVGMSAAESGFTVVSYKMNSTVSTMDAAESFLDTPTKWSEGYPKTNTLATIAFQDADNQTNFAPYSAFPGVDGDNFVLVVTGTVSVPRAGLWTFAVGSDDGFSCEVSRLGEKWMFENRGARGYGQSTATFHLPEAGAYDVRLVYFENGGGASLDFSVAEGSKSFSTDDFHLVGSAESGVLHAGAFSASVAADLADEMVGIADTVDWRGSFTLADAPAGDTFRLRVRYADGFSATLNGTPIASVPATGPRPAADALEYTWFDIPAGVVVQGDNTLLVTGVNDAIGDTEFFLSPEIVRDFGGEQLLYFPVPTPGAPNEGGRSGMTPRVSFSEPHGYKTGPIEVALSCPDDPAAPIYYTTDGTSPTIASTRYTEPIAISSTTVLRAAVPDADSILQQDSSASYLYLADIVRQEVGVVPAGFAENGLNGQKMVYGMRADIVDGDAETQAKLYAGFTNAIQTISLVIDPANLFDPGHGIYVNATGDGKGWERPTMVEQIDPVNGAAKEFSAPAGLRIRGAYSRGDDYPKHSFRLFFRAEYGLSRLQFPLFDSEGAEEFKKIDLRTSQNYSWANGNVNEFTLAEDGFSRDSQRDMGETYNRSRYYNLFLNGVYWGVYQTEERVDRHYAESYNGGTDDNYDVVRTSTPGYNTGVVEGDSEAWHALWDITVNEGYGDTHPDNYNRVRGLNPDGSRNPEYPVYLNVTNLAVYMIATHFTADSDTPANTGGMANNLAAFRDRIDGDGLRDGFLWNRHDAEHSLGMGGGYNNTDSCFTWGTRAAGHSTAIGNFNPAELHYELTANDEYRMTFADLVYKHCLKTGGAMTAPMAEARFRARMAELDDAIVGEAARWGRNGQTYSTWLNNGCAGRLRFIERRTPYLLQGYRNRGWYPSVDTPTAIRPDGGELLDGTVVSAETPVYLTRPSEGDIYYTTDGSDPRLEGGAVNPTATLYAGSAPVVTTNSTALFAKGAGGWQYYDWGRQPGDDTLGNAWNAAGYDAANLSGDANAWATGAAPLGFKSGVAFNTTLSRFEGHASSGNQVMAFYFRKTFTIPEGTDLSEIVALSGTAWYDDGYVMYLNGVEIGRGNIGAGYNVAYSTGTNETGTNYVDPEDHAFAFALPAGLLHAGENVLAVEVHQCHGTSSDAAWDLALAYDRAIAGTGTGGIAVPSEGLVLKARLRSASGEWSALEDVALAGEQTIELAAPTDALRVAELMTSSAGDGDEGDYIVLTNIAEDPIQLAGVRIVAWNAKKKSENDPSLIHIFGTALLEPGAKLTLAASEFQNNGKLTNSQVGLRLYDADGALVQDCFVDADWWDGACDGTGEHFVADEFGVEVKLISQWHQTVPYTTPAAALRVAELMTSSAGNGDEGDFIVLTNITQMAVSLRGVQIVAWNAKKNTEADPSLVHVFGDVDLYPGRTLTLGSADFQPLGTKAGKLTNSQVGLRLYDAESVLVQDCYVSADWWDKECDGTGYWFIALEFGTEIKTEAQWKSNKPVPQAPTDSAGNPVGTVDGAVATIDAALAPAGTLVNIPAGVAEVRMSVRDANDVVLDTTTYYTAASLTPQDGTVTPELDAAIVRPAFADSAPGAGDAIVIGDGTVHLTVSAKPGLYYTLQRSAGVGGPYMTVEGLKVQANAGETSVVFDVVPVGGEALAPASFFQTEVSDR